ncbi:MAG: YbhN family protein [Gemmatimonadota bacterium]
MRVRVIVRVLVTLAVLAALVLLLPWSDVRDAAGRMRPWVWLGALAAFLAGHRLGAAKWRMLLRAGRCLLTPVQAIRFYAAGLFANLCLPSIVGGDVLRAALAARETRRAEAAVLGGIGDRLVDVAVLALLIASGGILARGALPAKVASAVTLALLAGVAAASLTLILAARRPLRRWPARLRRPIGRALVGARRLARSPSTALAALAISLTMQSGFVLLNAWIGRSLGIDVPLGAWFLAWPLAKAAGLLPVSLGGLGVRDATLGAILVPLGVPMATGVVASLVWQSILIAGGLIAGGLWLALGRWSGAADRAGEPTSLRALGRARRRYV